MTVLTHWMAVSPHALISQQRNVLVLTGLTAISAGSTVQQLTRMNGLPDSQFHKGKSYQGSLGFLLRVQLQM